MVDRDLTVLVRDAREEDADGIAEVLTDLFAAGKRREPGDAGFVLSHYLRHPARLRCSVALDADGRLLGFQSLKIARAGNPYETPSGWGIIGTHIRPDAARKGTGARLFQSSIEAARGAGLPAIEAYIGADNVIARAYYASLGFETWREPDGVDAKCLRLAG